MSKRIDNVPSTADDFDDMVGVQVTENTGTLHTFLGESVTPETQEEAERLLTPHEVARREWVGMPEFHGENPTPAVEIKIAFRNEEDKIAFGEMLGQSISSKTKSIWWPEREPDQNFLKRYLEDIE